MYLQGRKLNKKLWLCFDRADTCKLNKIKHHDHPKNLRYKNSTLVCLKNLATPFKKIIPTTKLVLELTLCMTLT